MGTKLYVGGLSYSTTETSLSNFFSSAGTVASAKVITDMETGRPRGFGFVEMGSQQEAEKAITTLNGQSLDGRTITVNEARERERSSGGRSSGGGHGNQGGGYGKRY